MAEYLGLVELGGLYKNGVVQNRATKPWRIDSEPISGVGVGDIPDFNTLTDMSKWTIGNTPTSASQRLYWRKIKDGSKTLLVCDRNVLVNVSWDDLNAQGLVTGKTITIDGQQYLIRLMTGGSNYRSGSDNYSGGSPTNNEWDRFIVGEEAISGLPAASAADLNSTLSAEDTYSTNGATWMWAGVHSWAQETYTGNSSCRAVRGYNSARYWYCLTSSIRNGIIGWRPVLEVLNTAPLISDSDRDLGDKNSSFNITYQVSDADSADSLTVTEKLDGATTKTITNAQRSYTYTISIDIASVALGSHTVSIVVSDGKGGSATRSFTFKRVNSAPTISGSDSSLGDKNLGFTVTYQVNDADSDAVTVTEKLNGNVLKTVNNAPKGQNTNIVFTDEQIRALPLLSNNTVVIEARDPNGGVAYRTYTFRRTNTAPLITGVDEILGIVTGPVSKSYTVTDSEGDAVTINEKLDGQIIKTYAATLGSSNTVTIALDKWLKLTNDTHTLSVEATDGNGAMSLRSYTFEKHETTIKLELAQPFTTDAKANKILVTPTWSIEGATVKVEACNNAFDASPTWEDITTQVRINRHFNFTNTVKTAAKWGVNIRFEIVKDPAYQGEVSLRGFGGAFE